MSLMNQNELDAIINAQAVPEPFKILCNGLKSITNGLALNCLLKSSNSAILACADNYQKILPKTKDLKLVFNWFLLHEIPELSELPDGLWNPIQRTSIHVAPLSTLICESTSVRL